MPYVALLDQRAARLARRLEADARRLVGDLEHHRQPPWLDIRERLDVGQARAPVAGDLDLLERAAIALGLVDS